MTHQRILSSLKTLRSQWCAIGRVAVTAARKVLRWEKSAPRRALHQCEVVEQFLYTALYTLAQHIAEIDECRSRFSPEDLYERARLEVVRTCLLMLLKCIAAWKQQIEMRLAAIADSLPGNDPLSKLVICFVPRAPGYIDPG